MMIHVVPQKYEYFIEQKYSTARLQRTCRYSVRGNVVDKYNQLINVSLFIKIPDTLRSLCPTQNVQFQRTN